MIDTSLLTRRLAGFLGHHIGNATSLLQLHLSCVADCNVPYDGALVARNIRKLHQVREVLADPCNTLFVNDATPPMFTTPDISADHLTHNPQADSITVGDLTGQLKDKFDLPQFATDLSSKIDSMEAKLARKDLDSVTEFTDWFDATIKSLD